MATKIRQSKFRHCFGTEGQLHECYGNIRLGPCSTDSTVVKANSTFFAFPYVVPGSIAVVPLNQKGPGVEEKPVILRDDGQLVLELDWSPFDENLLASSWDDGAVQLHSIPEGGLTSDMKEAKATLLGHSKRLLYLAFHPLASDVLLTADAGKVVKLWDLSKGLEKLTLPSVHKGLLSNVSWNLDGSMMATASKDKTLRLFDPRSNAVAGEVPSHQGVKGFRVVWFGRYDRVFTVGFSKTSTREAFLHDPRSLATPLTTMVLDHSPSTIMPFYDEDLSLLYLGGKGDGNIRLVEVVENDLFPVTEFKSKDPQAGLACLPKTSVDVMKCEISRFLKVVENRKMVIPLRFEVPRQGVSQVFQEDLYPPSWDRKPTMTSDEFYAGATGKIPALKSMDPGQK